MPIIISNRAVEFCKKFDLDSTNLHHVNCGLHSGMPQCCILFYVKCWLSLDATACKDYDRSCKRYRNLYEDLDLVTANKKKEIAKIYIKNLPGYVRCPACIVNDKIVKIKRCRCNS